jgi:hypothetical protein
MTTKPLFAIAGLGILLAPVLVLRAQDPQAGPHGGLALECDLCHNPERWVPVDTAPKFRHESTGFGLEGSHAGLGCRSCHRSLVFSRVATACADCHSDAHRGELGARCESCHTPVSWSNQREMIRAHNRTLFPLLSVHARLDCEACHLGQKPYEYKTTPADCGECHRETYNRTTQPSHVQAGFSRRCQDCHPVTSQTWHEAKFSHPATFPLSGGHGGLTCARCHRGGSWAGLSQQCDSCHHQDYLRVTNPPHGGFPTTCETCHSVNAWRPAKFDHASTGYPLTGAHQKAECARCHVGGRYAGTSRQCVACHRDAYDRTSNPNHAAGGFPTTCESCHSTQAWRPANFDHNASRFPLSGAHARVDCSRCHTGGRYAGTPTDCYSCHRGAYDGTSNPNHAASGFPTRCQDCHNTSAWRPATFDHDRRYFPIYSGKHRGRWSACTDCHTSPSNYRAFDCLRCHDKGRTDSAHREVRGYQYSSAACYQCHPQGVGGDSGPRRPVPYREPRS